MDIRSGCGYPSSALSNFAPHPFVIDNVECSSMEGFLQSLKFKNFDMQKVICKLVGRAAKFKGKNKSWWRVQMLWWKGKKFSRHSLEYQKLLDRAFEALGKNNKFRNALLASQNARLTHSLGNTNANRTILTRSEFCGRLMRLREEIRKEEL